MFPMKFLQDIFITQDITAFEIICHFKETLPDILFQNLSREDLEKIYYRNKHTLKKI